MKYDKETAVQYIKDSPSYLNNLIRDCKTLIEGYQNKGLADCPLCETISELSKPFLVGDCSVCPWIAFTDDICSRRTAHVRLDPRHPAHKIEAKERIEELKTWIKTLKSWRKDE